MKIVLLNTSALLIGLITGSFVNMLIINSSASFIPPPNGIDVTTEAGLKEAMQFFEPKHFLFPFLAHAIGTLLGAFISTLIAKTYQKIFALIIGLAFLTGGIMMISMVPSPLWFTITDLLLAYLPMAFLGYLIANKTKKLFQK